MSRYVKKYCNDTNLRKIGRFANRKTLMRCTEQLEKNLIPVSSTDQPVLLDFFFLFFQKDLVTHSQSLREEVGHQTPQR